MNSAFAQQPGKAAAPPATAATTAAEGGAEPKGAFPPFDPSHYASQLFWLVVTFVALYRLMQRVAIPQISGILEDRDRRIDGDLAEARRLKAESDAAIAAYDRAVSDARGRAQAIASKANEAASAATEAKRVKTEAALAEKLAAAEARIGDIKEKALGEVGAIATEATDAVVTALIGKPASASEVAAAVNQVMAS